MIRTKTMTKEQRNDLCSSCHAKGSPLTVNTGPGRRTKRFGRWRRSWQNTPGTATPRCFSGG